MVHVNITGLDCGTIGTDQIVQKGGLTVTM